MTMSAQRLRSIGWLALLGVCSALVLVLSLRVNALKSEVRRAENRIVALKQETLYLQTEYKTRANQQQLRAWNDVDFGFSAPTAGQYLENERQLAALGSAVGPDAPAPVMVAAAETVESGGTSLPAMVNPLTGKPMGEVASDTPAHEASAGGETGLAKVAARMKRDEPMDGAAGLSARLGRIDHAGSEAEHDKPHHAKADPDGDDAKAAAKKAKAGPDGAKAKVAKAKAEPDKAAKDKSAKAAAATKKPAHPAKSASGKSPASKREPAA